eukprot:CAMPEP_0183295382 /NCGR_PEP_ID=MMETSP0160_2-20130417/3363_1 /TAXON_ID=2839 ORGANISM="Odontella Sinensis, Strain Grunow 1884" /NCGR_SAMPLE_ID=MMETSP0160_2 /ASSEMBLY_ACC=CAM_ASM_000250 /LENGTH=122 /DNA_ID=CAMNT_0025456861 /DNA_START=24 /DNA_END=392 /DNA_ORIENTATION=-
MAILDAIVGLEGGNIDGRDSYFNFVSTILRQVLADGIEDLPGGHKLRKRMQSLGAAKSQKSFLCLTRFPCTNFVRAKEAYESQENEDDIVRFPMAAQTLTSPVCISKLSVSTNTQPEIVTIS